MRKGKWFPKEKEMCEEAGNEEEGQDLPEDALPALEHEMKEEKDSGCHLVRVVNRYGMDYKGAVPTSAALCPVEQAYNVQAAYRHAPEPKKGKAGVWDNVNGIDRANKSILASIDSVHETLCSIRDMNRLIASASSKAQQALQEEFLAARTFVADTRRYIEAKFQKSFGSKVIKEGIPCFVRKDDSIKSPPTDFNFHFCVAGTVVGVDPGTRATIIAVGNERLQFHLPDHRVHFNRKDAEEGKFKRR
jgi:hypothetical protein